MFSPEKDLRDLVIEVLKKDPASISGLSRELAGRGVKMHRLELTGYLKALADLDILKEKEIKPSKVFSVSGTRDRSLYEMVGDRVNAMPGTSTERATIAAYCLQRLFKRAVFDMEVRRCGVDGIAEGRKATPEERAEAKSILTRMGYKVPNSDIPTVVESELEPLFVRVLADIVVDRFGLRSHAKETVQMKL
ncbi:MAG: hypothetical protein QG582_458 [Candidatus Thermoplasmatota archaeon]|nr:hypothetical protein [Candidatus Thermoplasmatota archaeon]